MRKNDVIRATWLTQGGMLFTSGRTRLLVDPYMSDFLEKNRGLTRIAPFPLPPGQLRPSWFFCTHDHLDHLDPGTVTSLAHAHPRCRFIGPESCYGHFTRLGIAPDRLRRARIGTALACGAFVLTPVAAFHTDPDAVGLVLAAGRRRIYLSGDTEFSPRLANAETAGCDTVLVCINGRLGNMGTAGALRVVAALRPRQALPLHYGLFAENTADPGEFIAGCRRLGINSFAMTPGREFLL